MTDEEEEIRGLLLLCGFRSLGTTVVSNYALNPHATKDGRMVLFGWPQYWDGSADFKCFRVFAPLNQENDPEEALSTTKKWLEREVPDQASSRGLNAQRLKLYPVEVRSVPSGYEAFYAPLQERITGRGETRGEALHQLEKEAFGGFLEAVEAAGETLPDPPCEKETG